MKNLHAREPLCPVSRFLETEARFLRLPGLIFLEIGPKPPSNSNPADYDRDDERAAGKRISVNPDVLREICKLVIATKHPRETADRWEVEYRPYEPDEKTLHALLLAKTRQDGSLPARLPKAPSPPRELPKQLHQAARDRLKMEEPASRIAQSYNVDVARIEDLGR
jgi:hypothetical protein